MIFESIPVGMLQTNCYIIGDQQSKQAVVIDPGGDGEHIVSRIRDLGLELQAILNTHAHYDHVMDAWLVKERLGGSIYLSKGDEPLLSNGMVGMAALRRAQFKASDIPIDCYLNEGDILHFGAIHLEVLATPGHSPGHMSFYFRDTNRIFVGDTLFAGSIGRTDFPGGSYEQLLRSVREKIFTLDDATLVLPGHGPLTTVAREKKTNPFFQ